MRATSGTAMLLMVLSCWGLGCQSESPALPGSGNGTVLHVPGSTSGDGVVTDQSPAMEQDRGSDSPNDKRPGRALFDGESLAGWEATNFGGEGEIEVTDGAIQLAMGYPMTGVTSIHKSLPTCDYEISLEAMRVDGNDFFCGLTFPVEESYCTLIVGGWGGTLVGLSSIDGMDAANNDTMRHMDFENERWYRVRVQVQKERISAWIDDELVVDQEITGKELTVRNEVLPSCPLGICGFQSQCAIRKIHMRHLDGQGEDRQDGGLSGANQVPRGQEQER